MKLKLAYIFLLGLFFFKAYPYTSLPAAANTHSFNQAVSCNAPVCFTSSQNTNTFLQHSLFIEDADEDDCSYEKKKQLCQCSPGSYNNSGLVAVQRYSFKNYSSSGKCPEYSFPAKYLLVRNIKI